MKNWFTLGLLLAISTATFAQKYDPITLMLAFQKKYAGITHFSGDVRWKKFDGESIVGHFVVDGERYHLTWKEGEILNDGTHEWEIMHRSKRVKKRYYDPLITPSVLMAFRFVRLDLMAEPVKIGGTVDKIAIDVEFGSSVAQGSHYFVIDQKTLLPLSITTHVTQEGYFETADIVEVRAGDKADHDDFTCDLPGWIAKGYTLTDMAKGENDAIWPEERALKN